MNQLLTNELTAINQYFIHAKMCQNWGYERLAARLRDESIDEMKHADLVISRILFLEGVPNLQRYHKLHVGETVREQLESDLQLEYAAIAFLNPSGRSGPAKPPSRQDLKRGSRAAREETPTRSPLRVFAPLRFRSEMVARRAMCRIISGPGCVASGLPD